MLVTTPSEDCRSVVAFLVIALAAAIVEVARHGIAFAVEQNLAFNIATLGMHKHA